MPVAGRQGRSPRHNHVARQGVDRDRGKHARAEFSRLMNRTLRSNDTPSSRMGGFEHAGFIKKGRLERKDHRREP
jgi:hypothetical protein